MPRLNLNPDHWPAEDCAFCDAPDADDVLREDGYPDVPLCSDADECNARRIRRESEREPQGEAVRLFAPAPTQLAGQLTMADVPPHLRGAFTPDAWAAALRDQL